ncbi:MAG: AI-2E family transporter [Acidobacteriota bacterium]|nr:MAG: AI-2E family transporter [Acidobacteriota bacterium]
MRAEVLRIVLGLAALAVVVWGAATVLEPFARPIIWAAVLGSATWPAYRWLAERVPGGPSGSALLMTALIALLVVLPVGGMLVVLAHEAEPIVEGLRAWISADQVVIPEPLNELPFARDIAGQIHATLSDPEIRRVWIRRLADPSLGGPAAQVGRRLVKNVSSLLLTLFTLFFVYRDGEKIALELRLLLDRIAGGRGMSLLNAVRTMVRAVVYGWLMTAAAQGLLAMVGYWLAGLQAPVLLGIATGLAAVIPFGITIVWVPVCAALLLSGHWVAALFVAAWTLAIVGVVDNLLRPLFISGPARVPFILVFFGLLGGLAAYGVLGIVLGPVFLAVLLALWRAARDALAEPEAAPAAGG